MNARASIIVEWDQARRQELARGQEMLRLLSGEVASLPSQALERPVEVLICGDDAALAKSRPLVADALADPSLFDVRFLAVPGQEYYEVKNTAVAETSGDLVVFLDCDVLPEPHWLARLLEHFADPEVAIVGGNSYVEPTGPYSGLFALTWIFPLRSETDSVGPMRRLATNNLALRREVALRFPFPAMPESSRGACQLLQHQLEARGVRMLTAGGARVRHPPPLGLAGFIVRAVSRGRDRMFFAAPGWSRTPLGTLHRLVGDLRRILAALTRRRRRVGLGLTQLPVALAIGVAFSCCSAAAELATMVNRGAMIQRFRV